MRKILLSLMLISLLSWSTARKAFAAGFVDQIAGEVKGAKSALENAKTSLGQAQKFVDNALGIFKFVEEKITMLYNFESFVNKVYSGALEWLQDTLKWVEEEKSEEVKKLDYEYCNCYTYI